MANIRRVMICINCDNDFELNGMGRCPSCGSTAVYPLSRWVVPVADNPTLECIEGPLSHSGIHIAGHEV